MNSFKAWRFNKIDFNSFLRKAKQSVLCMFSKLETTMKLSKNLESKKFNKNS